MGDFRHNDDQSLPPRYGNSPGADYFGGRLWSSLCLKSPIRGASLRWL